MDIRIDHDPPTEKEIQQEKQRLEQKLRKRKRQNVITYVLFITAAATLAYLKNSAIAEFLLSFGMVAAIISTFAMLAAARNCEMLYPMENDPGLSDMFLLGQHQHISLICVHDPVCQKYRKAVMAQQRQLTKEEAAAIGQWYQKKHQEPTSETTVNKQPKAQP